MTAIFGIIGDEKKRPVDVFFMSQEIRKRVASSGRFFHELKIRVQLYPANFLRNSKAIEES